jgi:hypothetical protein
MADRPVPKVLQGDDPALMPSRALVKEWLLDLLRNDADVRAAVAGRAPEPVEPDAAMGTWIKELIEVTLQQHMRPDAFRRWPERR